MTESPAPPPAATPPTDPSVCPHCGAPLEPGSKFCEACGKPVTDDGPAIGRVLRTDLDDESPISAVTARPGTTVTDAASGHAPAAPAPCAECGGVVGDDGYCTQCGTKAPSARDHFEEEPAPWVAGVCDRGIRHTRNEDAMALAVEGERAVLVVCDGVSNTVDSDVGSLAAARAVLSVLRPPLPRGLGVPESAAAAVTKVFTDAAAAGNTAIVATVTQDVPNPPSCTLVAAVLEDGVIHYCGIGDSRVYLLPDEGEGQILTVDDSMSQVMIAGGTPRAEAEASKQAHSITKWLGKDSPDIVPRVGSVEVTAPGWLLACSDGLWNYASEPAALRDQIAASGSADPRVIAGRLVDFANGKGGQDNITAALARVGGPLRPVPPLSKPASTEGGVTSEVASATSSTTDGATVETDVGKNASHG